MRLRLSVVSLALLAPAVAHAGDDQAPTPPPVRPSASSQPPAIFDEDRLASMVDQAVERAMARRQVAASPPASPSAGSPQSPAYGAPQGVAAIPPPVRFRIVAAETPRAIGTVPAYSESREYVQVMVPPGCCKRAAAAIGARLVQLGQPRLVTMRVAPSALVQEVPVQAHRPVYASGQGY